MLARLPAGPVSAGCGARDGAPRGAGDTAVYDADLQAYFDSIPHDKLMACVERRVADRSVLRLIRQWLTTPVEERDKDGRPRRRRPTQGTPQGGVISPLLANLYLHWFDVVFHRRGGPAQWAGARLVRYADDFVIMAKAIGPRLTTWVEATVEGWLGLTINRTKTRVVQLATGGRPGFSGLHLPVSAGSVWGRGAVVFHRRTIRRGCCPTPDEAARTHGQPARVSAGNASDRGRESGALGLGGVLQAWAPHARLPSDQCLCGPPHSLPFTPSESTPLPSTGRHD